MEVQTVDTSRPKESFPLVVLISQALHVAMRLIEVVDGVLDGTSELRVEGIEAESEIKINGHQVIGLVRQFVDDVSDFFTKGENFSKQWKDSKYKECLGMIPDLQTKLDGAKENSRRFVKDHSNILHTAMDEQLALCAASALKVEKKKSLCTTAGILTAFTIVCVAIVISTQQSASGDLNKKRLVGTIVSALLATGGILYRTITLYYHYRRIEATYKKMRASLISAQEAITNLHQKIKEIDRHLAPLSSKLGEIKEEQNRKSQPRPHPQAQTQPSSSWQSAWNWIKSKVYYVLPQEKTAIPTVTPNEPSIKDSVKALMVTFLDDFDKVNEIFASLNSKLTEVESSLKKRYFT